MADCPAICTEKFREPCCPWCPLASKERPPYGTAQLVGHLLTVMAERERQSETAVAGTPDSATTDTIGPDRGV